MKNQIAVTQRYHRLAVIGLWMVSMALGALMVIGVGYTERHATHVSLSTNLADAYDRAKQAVAAEESLERKYRLEPSEAVRSRHRTASDELIAALHEVSHLGNATDRALSDAVLHDHVDYVVSTGRMFDAVDAGNHKLATEIDNREIDPVAESIHQRVQTAADSHRRQALADVALLLRIVDSVFAVLLVGLLAGLVLLVLFSRILRHERQLAVIAREHEHQALHDALTGLPNRVLFTRRTEDAIERRGMGRHVAVMVLDLDRFKEVNDSLGHGSGDLLLHGIARRFSALLDTKATLARLSGDEFAVVLPDIADIAEAADVGARLVKALKESFDLSGHAVSVGVSIGISVAPENGTTVSELLHTADAAMYIAKHNQAGVTIFTQEAASEFWGNGDLPGRKGRRKLGLEPNAYGT